MTTTPTLRPAHEYAAVRPDAVASINAAPRPGVVENGNFAHARCDLCDWRGPGRRSRSTAEHDGALHALAGCGI